MSKNKRIRVFTGIALTILLFNENICAKSIVPSDYIIAGNIGNSWDYKKLDNTLFSWTLSEVYDETGLCLYKRGNGNSGMIYGLNNRVLTICELDTVPIPASVGFVLSKIELGQIITLNDDVDNPTMILFWRVPSVAVEADVYDDVIALVWLDNKYNSASNTVNTELNLPSSITAAVTDVDYFVRGVGQVKYRGVEASTGRSDGEGFELVDTTIIPFPHLPVIPVIINYLIDIN